MTVQDDSSKKDSSYSESWETPIIRVDGEVVGASMFLRKEDLKKLGINIENSEKIFYKLSDGECVELFDKK